MIKLLGFASIHLRPISDHVMLTVGRSAWDLLRSSSKEPKKKTPLQTALNGRPGAETNRREDGEGEAGEKGHIFTPDGPKWTARSGEGNGGVKLNLKVKVTSNTFFAV